MRVLKKLSALLKCHMYLIIGVNLTQISWTLGTHGEWAEFVFIASLAVAYLMLYALEKLDDRAARKAAKR